MRIAATRKMVSELNKRSLAGIHAVPRYITTKELNSLYQAGDTIDSYTERVIDYMTI